MQTFENKVAVVTGAASGIGRALALRFARARMRVVLADVERGALAEAAAAVGALGVEALAVPTDVSRYEDVEALARRAVDAFGAVHVLCNNAGVSVAGPAWAATLADWQWVLGVNLWGVIHGVHAFVPRLLAQGGEAHIVNTASVAGLTCLPGTAVYTVSKHGVVALSETLHHELAMLGAALKVSVLCPGFVSTRILESARNRPAALADTGAALPGRAEQRAAVRQQLAAAMPPEQVADVVIDAVRAGRFWVFPHPEWKARVQTRMEDIAAERAPRAIDVGALLAR